MVELQNRISGACKKLENGGFAAFESRQKCKTFREKCANSREKCTLGIECAKLSETPGVAVKYSSELGVGPEPIFFRDF